MIGGNEERHLKNKRQHTSEGIELFVVVLSVIGLSHHKAFIALEGLFDVLDPVFHFFLLFTFLILNGIGLTIKRQKHKIHNNAQGYYCHACTLREHQGVVIDKFINKLQRLNKELEHNV